MTTSSGSKRRHLASSPFPPEVEQIIETYAVGDLVSHDTYGMGRVVGTDAGAVTVDFGSQTLRVKSPFNKMELL
jgi:hypothetical protein